MKLKKIYKAYRFLPVGSLIHYRKKTKDIQTPPRSKARAIAVGKELFHSMYAAFAFTYMVVLPLINYAAGLSSTGKLNPIKQIETRRTYENAWEKLLGGDGLADINGDRKVDLIEKAEAWKRMGLGDEPYFARPSIGQLETAIQSYEEEKRGKD